MLKRIITLLNMQLDKIDNFNSSNKETKEIISNKNIEFSTNLDNKISTSIENIKNIRNSIQSTKQ